MTPQSKAAEKYRNGLAALAGLKGQRNTSLLGLTNLGIMAGLSDERIESEVIDASGTPPLTSAEVRHAIQTARRDTQPLGDGSCTGRTWRPTPPQPSPLGSGARSFVQRMIEAGTGTTFETLAECSPFPIPEVPTLQTSAFLKALYSPKEWVFCGRQYSRGFPGADLNTCAEWLMLYGSVKLDAPELLCCNPLTGKAAMNQAGKPSFRCAGCVSEYRYTLVEFDALSLEGQAAFWTGVIRNAILPVKSLVYSGGKSIHGLVKVGTNDFSVWKESTETLLYATCHPDAPAEHKADRACRSTCNLTRLAGGRRSDTGKVQSLLWLSQERPS